MDRGNGLRLLPAAVGVLGVLAAACGSKETHYAPNVEDGAATPTIATADVSTLISDSGYTRYRIDAPLWLIYDDCEEPYWRFPDGLEFEQYDNAMAPQANVIADSAVYWSRLRLWRLDGRVVMVNTMGDSFLTEQIFWDQTSQRVYSDSFVHIVRSDRILEGYGFNSNQNMTAYTLTNPTAILPSEGFNRRQRADSATADTAPADTVRPDSTPAAPRRRPTAQQRHSNLRPADRDAELIPITGHPAVPARPTR